MKMKLNEMDISSNFLMIYWIHSMYELGNYGQLSSMNQEKRFVMINVVDHVRFEQILIEGRCKE